MSNFLEKYNKKIREINNKIEKDNEKITSIKLKILFPSIFFYALSIFVGIKLFDTTINYTSTDYVIVVMLFIMPFLMAFLGELYVEKKQVEKDQHINDFLNENENEIKNEIKYLLSNGKLSTDEEKELINFYENYNVNNFKLILNKFHSIEKEIDDLIISKNENPLLYLMNFGILITSYFVSCYIADNYIAKNNQIYFALSFVMIIHGLGFFMLKKKLKKEETIFLNKYKSFFNEYEQDLKNEIKEILKNKNFLTLEEQSDLLKYYEDNRDNADELLNILNIMRKTKEENEISKDFLNKKEKLLANRKSLYY